MPLDQSPVVEKILGCAIDVHRALGPGLLESESAYGHCLAHLFNKFGIRYQRQLELPVLFDGTQIDCGYRLDFLVEGTVVVELKSVERILPVHIAQSLTYVKLSGATHGLLLYFNVEILKKGITSLVNPAHQQHM